MLLIGMLVPIALAHNQAPAAGDADVNVILNPPHIDNNRGNGAVGGVSGRYVTSEDGVYLSVAGLTPITVGDITLFPNGGFVISAGGALCDLEVLGDGTAPDPLLDETIVDAAAGGTVIPNGLFDDGGIGGACHTTSYNHPAYNTPGCPAGSGVRAEDAVSGGGVWIGAACDTTRAAPGGTPSVVVLALCLVNELIQGADPAVLVGCVSTFISCTAPGNDCTVPAPPVCGQDNVSDTINFGTGNGHAAATTTFVADPACPVAGGSAQVFTFDSVRVDLANPTASAVSVVTTGWIDQA